MAMRTECGVNVTVCEWDDREWDEHAAVVDAVIDAVARCWSTGLPTEDIEDDLLAAFGERFAEACVEATGSELQVTLVTHSLAGADC